MKEAQERISDVAVGLARLFTPMRAAALLAGAALTLVRSTYGRDAARDFFAGVAEEIENERSEIVN
jgi:hypothetical protein